MRDQISIFDVSEGYEQKAEYLLNNCEDEPEPPKHERTRAYRRVQKRKTINRLLRRDKYGEARNPFVNRVVIYFDDEDLSDFPEYKNHYIRYGYAPRKQLLKKYARRRFRKNKKYYFQKGNGYRRTFDYRWNVD